MKKRTRIIATLGPATDSKTILKMVEAGMNVARLNCSHGNKEQFKLLSDAVRAAEKKTGKSVSIMLDLQGPKIRLGDLDQELNVKKGDKITLSTRLKSDTKKGLISVPYKALAKIVKKGQSLLIEDGSIQSKVLSTNKESIRIEIQNQGVLKSKKGINIPDAKLPHSELLTQNDQALLQYALEKLDIDTIAVSFVESAKDLEFVRSKIPKNKREHVQLIAKIERKRALENIDSILESSDGIMVARGDLGIETPAQEVPIVQRKLVTLARKQGKPVIIATQILQSMVESPRATRAEVSDAARAIFEHADAFMLSNETAVGRYPIKAVQTLSDVALSTESAIFKEAELFPIPLLDHSEFYEEESLAFNAALLSEDLNAKALVIFSEQGRSVKAVMKHRPETPVFVLTSNPHLARKLQVCWGIQEVFVQKQAKGLEAKLRQHKELKKGDTIVVLKMKDRSHSIEVIQL